MGDDGADCTLDNTQLLDRVDAPCVRDEETQRFLRTHGRLLLMVRGPPGSGKNIIAAELEELYPDSRAYWSDKLFSSPMAPERNSVTIRESHDLCLSKIEGFMKNDVPMIINKNTNVMVWEIGKFLVLASRYGYTVILVDMPHHFVLDPKVLTATNNKGLSEQYLSCRVKQWEEVHPFATGWSPRPKDAARLLQRFRQLRTALREEDSALDLKAVANTCVFPFCLARLCLFGRAKVDSDYCCSEKVRKAYGRSDTIRVFGYAITQGFVFAMVELSDDQASLTKGQDSGEGIGNAGGADDDMDAVTLRFSMSLSPSNWEEVACIVDLAKFATEDGGRGDGEDGLRSAGEGINLKVMGDSGSVRAVNNTELLHHVDAPCIKVEKTQHFLRTHGRLLFLVRGPPGMGKGIVVDELEQLYPNSRSYWSDKLFTSPMAPERNKETMHKSHVLCAS
ncbi:hypothetical protein V5799_009100, partial [Amblyomma americanum]